MKPAGELQSVFVNSTVIILYDIIIVRKKEKILMFPVVIWEKNGVYK